MSKQPERTPEQPELVCWGCGRNCPAQYTACGRAPAEHPCVLFGDDWFDWRPELGVYASADTEDEPAAPAGVVPTIDGRRSG